MKIRDVSEGPPVLAIAVSSRAIYRVADLPKSQGKVSWKLEGDNTGLAIEGGSGGEAVVVIAVHPSARVNAATLIATITPEGDEEEEASIGLTAFAAEIRNADDSQPTTLDIGRGNNMRYVAATRPDIGPFQPVWIPGSDGGIGVVATGQSGEVEVRGLSVSRLGRDASLRLAIGSGAQVAATTIPICVFGVEIRLRKWIDEDLQETGAVLGIGETRVASARIVPDGVLPPVSGWSWQAEGGLKLMGDINQADASLVAEAPGRSGRLEVSASVSGAAVSAELRNFTVYGIRIEDDQGQRPQTALAVGMSTGYRALVEPSPSFPLTFWTSDASCVVEQQGLSARVTGALPSAAEGQNGLRVTVLAGEALAQALVPLTIYKASISLSQDGGSQKTYAVSIEPDLPWLLTVWGLKGDGAAITGATMDRQVVVMQVQQAVSAVLEVSVFVPGADLGTSYVVSRNLSADYPVQD